jgi:hypothetical protein
LYVCWDGSDWEWPNYQENDLTPDNSLLTSVETDHILETSPSETLPDAFELEPDLKDSKPVELLTDAGDELEAAALPGYDLELESFDADYK